MNASTIIVGLIVLAVFVLIVRNYIKNIISGKGNCACGCENCPGHSICHAGKKTEKAE